jgi:hypothetical protein
MKQFYLIRIYLSLRFLRYKETRLVILKLNNNLKTLKSRNFSIQLEIYIRIQVNHNWK